MNLYDFSARNREIAVLLTAADDAEAFADTHEEVRSILRAAQHGADHQHAGGPSHPLRPAAHEARAPAPVKPSQPQKPTTAATPEGHCIRCGKGRSYDPEHPLCRPCYEVWATWKNVDYEENHCHRCGAEEATSVARPLCGKCFRAAPFTPRRHAFS